MARLEQIDFVNQLMALGLWTLAILALLIFGCVVADSIWGDN